MNTKTKLSSEDWKEIEYDDYKGFLIEYKYVTLHTEERIVKYRIRDTKNKEEIIYRSGMNKNSRWFFETPNDAWKDAESVIDKLNI